MNTDQNLARTGRWARHILEEDDLRTYGCDWLSLCPASLYAFDVLAVDGRDLRELALLERKGQLAPLVYGIRHMQYVEHLDAHGEALFAKACELDLEGIMAKRADSPYKAGRQTTWLKIKN